MVKVYHFRRNDGKNNFGDDLSPGFISAILNTNIDYATPLTAQIMGAGSILSYWTKRERALRRGIYEKLRSVAPIAIWGSGLIAERNLIMPTADILAVRGPLTANSLKVSNNVTYGDPGLLASLVAPAAIKTDKIGIIPHYVDKSNPALSSIAESTEFLIIDVEAPWEQVLNQISSCTYVLSSSLHGLIVADSYGIPNIRLKFSDLLNGGDFKFKDYCLSVGRSDFEGRVISSIKDIHTAVNLVRHYTDVISPSIIRQRQTDLTNTLLEWWNKAQ